MSTWFSLEDFLHGRTASWIRRSLCAVVAYGVGSDYYVMHYYHSFPVTEAQRWVVDNSAIGRPRPVLYVLPSAHYTIYSPWTPSNGEVVLARRLKEHPHWIQLIGGRYLEADTCGVSLCMPEEEFLRREKSDRLLKQPQVEDAGRTQLRPWWRP